jgi:hypothetical protein
MEYLKFDASNVHLNIQNNRYWSENNPPTEAELKEIIWCAVSTISRQELQFLIVHSIDVKRV